MLATAADRARVACTRAVVTAPRGKGMRRPDGSTFDAGELVFARAPVGFGVCVQLNVSGSNDDVAGRAGDAFTVNATSTPSSSSTPATEPAAPGLNVSSDTSAPRAPRAWPAQRTDR
jgi:hypothetical protein